MNKANKVLLENDKKGISNVFQIVEFNEALEKLAMIFRSLYESDDC